MKINFELNDLNSFIDSVYKIMGVLNGKIINNYKILNIILDIFNYPYLTLKNVLLLFNEHNILSKIKKKTLF